MVIITEFNESDQPIECMLDDLGRIHIPRAVRQKLGWYDEDHNFKLLMYVDVSSGTIKLKLKD